MLFLAMVYFVLRPLRFYFFIFFFFNDTATTEIYTLSLHDALPIPRRPPVSGRPRRCWPGWAPSRATACARPPPRDRKSTRLNSSHVEISYAVFCLKKKKKKKSIILFNYKKK